MLADVAVRIITNQDGSLSVTLFLINLRPAVLSSGRISCPKTGAVDAVSSRWPSVGIALIVASSSDHDLNSSHHHAFSHSAFHTEAFWPPNAPFAGTCTSHLGRLLINAVIGRM